MSLKEHREGSAARLAGKPKTDNPYLIDSPYGGTIRFGTPKAREWDQGWEAADADQREDAFKSFTPSRVLVSADGDAVSPERAELEFGVQWDVAFIRNDGWSLGAPARLKQAAKAIWEGYWVKEVHRNGTIMYLGIFR